ncbi:hypothetical protein M501DRAFT_1058394 [Patellaria atrata CBS 101060]|uniref:Uncharacterized protein n=1 Tax=Patellaria atrata CBS 101060 TaxID=1346257 RepID=A0A9P4VQD8_9PEZI|nr:hypothetical protein M501DRAFT_1058394 [Patellaria atrata CBS 101060]
MAPDPDSEFLASPIGRANPSNLWLELDFVYRRILEVVLSLPYGAFTSVDSEYPSLAGVTLSRFDILPIGGWKKTGWGRWTKDGSSILSTTYADINSLIHSVLPNVRFHFTLSSTAPYEKHENVRKSLNRAISSAMWVYPKSPDTSTDTAPPVYVQ